jgi:hypothetical protein
MGAGKTGVGLVGMASGAWPRTTATGLSMLL